jgi:hypothetical protein
MKLAALVLLAFLGPHASSARTWQVRDVVGSYAEIVDAELHTFAPL